MSQVMEMVEIRRGNRSYEVFGREIGVNGTTLFKTVKEGREKPDRDLSVPTIKKMVAYFSNQNDIEMVQALIEYATGLDVTNLNKILSPS